jgi:CheY-like chemotaxis protein
MTRILVVDDDPLIRTAIGAWLAAEKIEAVAADGARAGLKALERVAFDLMIIDIFMPDMEGLESIRIFHHRAPRMPIIAMSGMMFHQHSGAVPDFLGMSTRLGATHCLRKPFRPKELLQAIERCLPAASSGAFSGKMPALPNAGAESGLPAGNCGTAMPERFQFPAGMKSLY